MMYYTKFFFLYNNLSTKPRRSGKKWLKKVSKITKTHFEKEKNAMTTLN